jgi:hypothetical protein
MGAALWLYGWLILRQTRQEQTLGFVLGGKPVTYREIEEETGFARKTLERWMQVLRRNGYIETRVVTAGIIVKVTKAKKFGRLFGRNPTQADSTQAFEQKVCGDSCVSMNPLRIPPASLRQSAEFTCPPPQIRGDIPLTPRPEVPIFEAGRSQVFHTKSSEVTENSSRDACCQHSGAGEWAETARGCGNSRQWSYRRNELSSERRGGRVRATDWRALREELVRRELRVGAGPEVQHRARPAADSAAQVEEHAAQGAALEAEPCAPLRRGVQGNLFDSLESRARPQKRLAAVERGSKAVGAA